MEQYLIEMTVYDPALPGVKTLYFSTRGYTSPPGATPANCYYAPRILEPGNFDITLFGSGKTFGASRIGFGEVRLTNADGGLDQLIDYGFDGRTIVFKKLTALGVVLILASCAMEQPEFNDDNITIRIKDPQTVFSAALQSTKYAGTNPLPAGIEGTADIKGKPKPVTVGAVYNVTPVLVNTSKLIYQLHTGTLSIPAVYDKGVPLYRGVDYASQSAMEATAPNPGEYRVWPAGGCFRLGASPAGAVTADAVEGATAADRTAAQVAKRLASRVMPAGDIDAADVTALDAANPAEVGYYASEETTVMAALDEVLGSVGAWYGFDAAMKLHMQRFTAPAGTADLELSANQVQSVERIASSDPGRGVPIWKVNLSYAKNYTVQTTDLAGTIQTARTSFWEEKVLPASQQWKSIAYGNGVFVAVAQNSATAARSVDGVNWTAVTLPASVPWSSVTYGGGLFVAVASGTTIAASSPDGVTWTQRALPLSLTWQSVAYGNGVFVAVAMSTEKVAVSSDGISWATQSMPTSPPNQLWMSVTYGNGTFVAVSVVSNIAATSPDGVTWTFRTIPATANWRSIAYGNGVFVAVADDTDKAASSPDGINWEVHSTTLKSYAWAVAFGNGAFMAIGSTTITAVSEDGVRWSPKPAPAVGSLGIAYGNNMFVMPSFGSNHLYRCTVAASGDRLGWLAQQYRTVSASDASVLTAHLLASELNVFTLLIDPTAAQAEADRLLALYKVRRDTVKVRVDAGVVDYLQPGKVVKLFYPRYGYNAGKLFCVIGVTPEWSAGAVTFTLWG